MGNREEGNDRPTIDTDANLPLHLISHRLPHAVVITATGEVDLATSGHLANVVQTGFDGCQGMVVIELSAVTFLSSIGLAVLIEAQQTADRSRQSLRIVVGDGRPVIRAIVASGLSDRLPVFRSLEEALTAV
jgi:anti-sigma B factor antagonist